MTAVIVAGAVANKAGNGGATWTRLSWALGLAELGFDVHFVEELAPGAPAEAETWFAEVMGDVGLTGRATLLREDGTTATGASMQDLIDLAEDTELLVNISGHLTRDEIVKRAATTVFVDLDPGYTQLWHADGTAPLRDHDHWFTVGTLVGTSACSLPTGGLQWRPTLQPVVLDQWPVQAPLHADRFTTVASWRGPYGPVEHDGQVLGSKVHEFRRFVDLPERVDATLELCLDIHDGDAADRERFEASGWRVIDASNLASPQGFRQYVQGSPAELSVAQAMYVHTSSGWFSDRSVRYLASGRPVVVQDTGFSRHLPTGEGILSFTTVEGAAVAVADVMADHERHAAAARALAVEHFAAERVLGRLCEEVGVVV